MIHWLGWEEEERLALIAKERYSSLGLEGDELVKEEFRTKYEEKEDYSNDNIIEYIRTKIREKNNE